MGTETVGIIGVGLMGQGIASNIVGKGWPLVFLDHPGNQPTNELVAAGARAAKTPREVAQECDTVILCVTGSPQVEAVLTGDDGVLEGLAPGAVVIDCSTALPGSTQRMAALVEEAGGRMIDAPMTRTPKEAAEGRLNLIVGGDRATFEAKRPLLAAFAENITYAGESGSGHALKLLHNFVSLGFSAVLGEAAAASKGAGIDPAVLEDVLTHGGGAGIVLDRMRPFILNEDVSSFRFTLANAFKDLDYYCAMASDQGAAAQVAEAVRRTYETGVAEGGDQAVVPELINILSRG